MAACQVPGAAQEADDVSERVSEGEGYRRVHARGAYVTYAPLACVICTYAPLACIFCTTPLWRADFFQWRSRKKSARHRGVCAENACQRGVCAENARQKGVCAANARQRGASAENARQKGVCAKSARQRGVCAENAHQRGVCADHAHQRGVSNIRPSGIHPSI